MALAVVLSIVGCAGNQPAATGPTASPSVAREPNTIESPSAAPWAGPTDGTWPYGDIAYMQPTTIRGTVKYTATLAGPPTFGPLQSGDEVAVTSPFTLTRVEDAGYGQTIAEDNRFFFSPGPNGVFNESETYGTYTDLVCDKDTLAEGETTSCTVSFVAPTVEIQDFYWSVNGQRVAAWPGQLAS